MWQAAEAGNLPVLRRGCAPSTKLVESLCSLPDDICRFCREQWTLAGSIPGVIFTTRPSIGPGHARLRSAPRSSLLGLVGACLILSLNGCGAGPDAAESPTDSPSVTTPTAVASTSAPVPEPTDSPSEVDDPIDPSTGESDKPPVLDKNASGRDLTTADFFATPEEWRDGRFNVAGKQALAGIAGPLNDCEEQSSDYTPTIELRLANNFSKVSMKIGQSDDSKSSDATVFVKLLGNGKYIDSSQVAFNKIQSLDASVADVNALKIQVWRGGEHCETSVSSEAVLMELKVE
jgi:hypothetical protein